MGYAPDSDNEVDPGELSPSCQLAPFPVPSVRIEFAMPRYFAKSLLFATCLLSVSLLPHIGSAHDGPDPLAHWSFTRRSISDQLLEARLGPNAKMLGPYRLLNDAFGDSVLLNGRSAGCEVTTDLNSIKKYLPTKDLTVSAWVSIKERKQYGGIVGTLQDNGDSEKGWLLGYDEDVFAFALASKGADDGDGKMTYLRGKTKYETDKLYHVVAVYDGSEMQLYVNGQLDGSTTEQNGEILYPETAPFMLGAYRDRNEHYPLVGTLRDIALYDLAAKQAWVSHEFGHGKELTELPPVDLSKGLSFVVKPYLQFGTQTAMTVMWQTSAETTGKLCYGETAECENEIEISDAALIHELRIEDLQPETQYFYRVESVDADGGIVESDVSTLVTAVKEETPFAFAVISDTQSNPKVVAEVSKHAWAQRPSFLLHPGDLVSTGTEDTHWTQHFFPNMHELISRVPFYPVLGNHERNAKNYYDYMSLPDPEYYYEFKYGNAHFFMIDSNKKVGPGSEQYKWLEEALSKSTATWKFVCHHHPVYSSDENDYGDLWKTNKSTHGDLRVRELTPLYEKYDVDIVWNGHIHSYERTWPVESGKVKEKGAPIYMITGGGGGGLETPGPVRPFFQNTVRRGHHYVMVRINGGTLEFQAYDLEDRLFDFMKIEKKVAE